MEKIMIINPSDRDDFVSRLRAKIGASPGALVFSAGVRDPIKAREVAARLPRFESGGPPRSSCS